MLPEDFEQAGVPESVEPTRQPEFVGAPTEYAERDEVPRSIAFAARVLAGGAITWTVLAAVLGILVVGCAVCAALFFLLGVVLK